MRKKFLAAAIGFFSYQSSAQVIEYPEIDTTFHRTVDLQANIAGAFNGNYSIYAGWNFATNSSLGLNVGYLSQRGEFDRLREGFHISPEYRYFFGSKDTRNRGFFIGPYVKYGQGFDNNRLHVEETPTDTTVIPYNMNYQRLTLGANVGLVNIPAGRLLFSVWAGFGAHVWRDEVFSIDPEVYTLEQEFGDLWDARLEVGVGYRF